MQSEKLVKKQTLYLATALALIIGFVGGVFYSSFRAPLGEEAREAGHQHDASQAIAALEQATRDRPDDGQAWVELGHAYFDTSQATKAIAAYNRALELLPGDLNVMTDLGVMYHQNSEHQKAIAMFDQVLKIDPKHQQARFNKGVVLLTGLNDRQAALAEWKILVGYHPMATTPSGSMVVDLIKQMESERAGQ